MPSRPTLLLEGPITSAPDSFDILHLAAGKLLLNEQAVAVLVLCDGSSTKAQIIARLARQGAGLWALHYASEFLDAALRNGWLTIGPWSSDRRAPAGSASIATSSSSG